MTQDHDIDARVRGLEDKERIELKDEVRSLGEKVTVLVSEVSKDRAVLRVKMDRLLSHNGQSVNPWVDRSKVAGGGAIMITVLGLLAQAVKGLFS